MKHLAPSGSGAADSSIHLSAYGEGARPRIVAAPGAEAALRLFNQQYWDIDSLDIGWGTYGFHQWRQWRPASHSSVESGRPRCDAAR